MRTYLVFEPVDGARNAAAAEDVRFVREKFIWTALLFAPLWLLWHRLWLGLFGWLAAMAAVGVLVRLLQLDPVMTVVGLFLPSLVLAFEGTELRRRKLLRSGLRDAGVAIGEDREDAERRFFAAWAARADVPPPARPAPPAPLTPPAQESVIGLFPEPGAGR